MPTQNSGENFSGKRAPLNFLLLCVFGGLAVRRNLPVYCAATARPQGNSSQNPSVLACLFIPVVGGCGVGKKAKAGKGTAVTVQAVSRGARIAPNC